MTAEQINKCIEILHEEISKVGSASVGKVIKDITKYATIADFTEKVSARMIESGEYIRTQRGDDYFISRNPNFEINKSLIAANESAIRTNESLIETNRETKKLYKETLPENFKSQEKFATRSLWLALVSVAFIIITTVLQFLDTTPQKVQQLKEEVKRLDSTAQKIQLSLESLADSIVVLKKDSVSVRVEK